MKTIGIKTRIKNIVLAITATMMVSSFSPCVAQINFLISPVLPAARGSVKVQKDKYNNYVISIRLSNLAEAVRLQPPKNTYVVWMLTEDGLTQNIGQIRTTYGFLTKQLKAYMKTKSSFKPVKIFITAEYDPNLQHPSSEAVLTTESFDLPN
jgi:hypothetical protein